MAKSSSVFDKDLRADKKTNWAAEKRRRFRCISWDVVLLCQQSNVPFDLSMAKYKANNNLVQWGCKDDSSSLFAFYCSPAAFAPWVANNECTPCNGPVKKAQTPNVTPHVQRIETKKVVPFFEKWSENAFLKLFQIFNEEFYFIEKVHFSKYRILCCVDIKFVIS